MHELLITNNASLLEQQQRRALAKALSPAAGYSHLL